MRLFTLACALAVTLVAAPARAEEHSGTMRLDWLYDFGLTLPHEARFPHRFLFRWETESHDDGADVFSVLYGRGWRLNGNFGITLSAGYAGTSFDAGPARHEFELLFAKNAAWDGGRIRARFESAHFWGSEGYRYRGNYAFDWWFVGAHAVQEGKDFQLGFQLSSGPNAEIPLRVEVRHSFGITDGAPDHVARILVVMDMD